MGSENRVKVLKMYNFQLQDFKHVDLTLCASWVKILLIFYNGDPVLLWLDQNESHLEERTKNTNNVDLKASKGNELDWLYRTKVQAVPGEHTKSLGILLGDSVSEILSKMEEPEIFSIGLWRK